MGELTNWVNENSQFLKIPEGGSYKGKYGGYTKGDYNGKPVINYKLDDKCFSSGSKKLAMMMDTVQSGDNVEICKFGSGTDTTYKVRVIADTPADAQEKKEKEELQTAWDES